MNKNELTKLINAHESAELVKAKEQELAMIKRIAKYKDELYSWNSKVKEWIENMNTLISRGYVFYTDLTLFTCNGVTDKHRLFSLGTDGVYHNFGSFEHYDAFRHRMPFVKTLGKERGGACGVWDLHTDGETWWIEHECTGERRELRECDYRILERGSDGLNQLERFEKKINAVYDYLRKSAA